MRTEIVLSILAVVALSCSELYPAPDAGKSECKSGTDEFTGDWLFSGTVDGRAAEFPLSIDIACIGEHRAFIPPGCTMFHTRDGDVLTGREVTCSFTQAQLAALKLDGASVEFEDTVSVHFHDGQVISHADGVLTMSGTVDLNGGEGYPYSFSGVRP